MLGLNDEDFKRLYIDQNMTYVEIAKHFGVHPAAINYWRRKLGLKKRYVCVIEVTNGYRFVKVPDHPCASQQGYIPEHRQVVEAAIGRYVKDGEHVHHINFQKMDNRIENLSVLPRKEHGRIHNYMGKVGAYMCGMTAVRPEPLAFGAEVFWGGRYVTYVDLIPDQKVSFASAFKAAVDAAGETTSTGDAILVN